MYLGRALERLGDAALKEQEPDIGAAFLKFAVVTKELSALMKTLVSADLCCVRNFSLLSFTTFRVLASDDTNDRSVVLLVRT